MSVHIEIAAKSDHVAKMGPCAKPHRGQKISDWCSRFTGCARCITVASVDLSTSSTGLAYMVGASRDGCHWGFEYE